MTSESSFVVDCRGQPAVAELVGEGPNLVLVGLAVSMAWSRPVARSLAARGYRVLNFDYGPPPDWHGETVNRSALDQVQDVVEVMAAAGMSEAHAIGLSRGAITAYGLAARHPALVWSLVLCVPVAGYEDTLYSTDPDLEQQEEETDEQYLDRMVESVFSAGFLETGYDEARSVVTSPPGSVDRLERKSEEPFAEGDVVACPTLVIEAGDDQIVGSEHPNRYVSAMPEATHVVIEAASHGWPMEEPDLMATIVEEFVQGLPPER